MTLPWDEYIALFVGRINIVQNWGGEKMLIHLHWYGYWYIWLYINYQFLCTDYYLFI